MINPSELYAKSLLSLGYGYPLWTPEPSHDLLQINPDGLQIGDVGVINTDSGGFDVFFNICLPSDHPTHRATGVPDNFVPVKLDDSDVARVPSALRPGHVFSTHAVTSLVETSGKVVPPGRPTYEFSLPPGEGALLVLPDGAERYKLRRQHVFQEAATRNAFDWYNFAEQHLGRIISHDALLLITGIYKARSWTLAAFREATGSADSVARLKASEAGDGGIMPYTWESTRALDWRIGPTTNSSIPNQSVFIDGFRIRIKTGILGTRWTAAKLFPGPTESQLTESSENGNGPRPSRPRNVPWGLRGSRSSEPTEQKLQLPQDSSGTRSDVVSSNMSALQSFTRNEQLLSRLIQEDEERFKASRTISKVQPTKGRSVEKNAALRPSYTTVREILYLASRRQSTRVEDMAYSLFGLFDAAIPIMYGEGNRAVGRLLEYVLTDSGDITILAWTGHSGPYHSCLPVDLTVYSSLVPPHVPQPIEKEEMDKAVAALRSSVLDPAPAVKLYEQLRRLDPPSMTARRLRLPCIAFRLDRVVSQSGPDPTANLNVYRAELSPLWSTDIQTTDNLAEMQDLYLVHPWIRPLLSQELADGAGALDDVTRAFRLVVRLRQSFGALLLERLSPVEYKRVATDSLIMVQFPEEVSLAQLIDSVHMIDVT